MKKRKMTFDAECRKMLFAVCERHNLHLEVDPAYGGRDYLEKQDFIIAKQKGTIAEQGEAISQQRAELVGVSRKVSEKRTRWHGPPMKKPVKWLPIPFGMKRKKLT